MSIRIPTEKMSVSIVYREKDVFLLKVGKHLVFTSKGLLMRVADPIGGLDGEIVGASFYVEKPPININLYGQSPVAITVGEWYANNKDKL